MAIYFFTFLALPTPDAKEFEDAAGAYVNCWMRNETGQNARERAEELIRDYGWSVEGLEEEAVVTGDDYADDDEDREFYEQALMEDEVLVFNTWPREAEDAD